MHPDPTVTPSDLLKAIRRRALVVLACGVLFAGASAFWSARNPRSYLATAQVLLTHPAAPVLGEANDKEADRVPSPETQIAMLQSPSVAERVVRRAGDEAKLTLFDVRQRLAVEEQKHTSILEFSGMLPEPKRAAALANAAAAVFVEQNEELFRDRAKRSLAFAEAELPKYRDALRSAERSLRLFREASGTAQLPEGPALLARALETFETAAAQAEVDLREERKRAGELQHELSRENRALADPATLRNNALIEQLKQQLVDAEAKHALAQRKYTDRYPNVLPDLKTEIEGLQSRLTAELAAVVRGEAGDLTVQQSLVQKVIDANSRLLGLEARGVALREIVSGYRRQIEFLPAQEQELARLQREAAVAEELYSSLLRSREELLLSTRQERGAARVIAGAEIPQTPHGGGAAAHLGLGLMMGLIVGFVAALLLEGADRAGRGGGPAQQLVPSHVEEPEQEEDLSGRVLASPVSSRPGRKLVHAIGLSLGGVGVVAVVVAVLQRSPVADKIKDPASRAAEAAQTTEAAEQTSDAGSRSLAPLRPSLGDLVSEHASPPPPTPPPESPPAPPERRRTSVPVARWSREPVAPLPLWPSVIPPPAAESASAAEPASAAESASAAATPDARQGEAEDAGEGAVLSKAGPVSPAEPAASAAPGIETPGVTPDRPGGTPPEPGQPEAVPRKERAPASPPDDEAGQRTPALRPVQQSSGKGSYALWIGPLERKEIAEAIAEGMRSHGVQGRLRALTGADGAATYGIEVGPYPSRRDAQRIRDKLLGLGTRAQVVYRFRL